MSDEKPEQNVILITEPSNSKSGQIHSEYTITVLSPTTPPGIVVHTVSQLSEHLQKKHIFSQLPPYLRLPPEDLHIILSTKSGAEQAGAAYDNMLKPLLKIAGLDETSCKVLKTESSDTIKEFAGGRLKGRADKGIAQTVLLLSGDGGIVDVVNGLMKDGDIKSSKFVRPTIVLFPLGTGNALFHSLHRPPLPSIKEQSTPQEPTDLTLALRSLLFGTPSSIPVFRAHFSPGARVLSNHGSTALPLPPSNTLYGAIVASYGLHATLVADSDTAEWRQHGAARFGQVAGKLLSSPHAYRARLVLRLENGREAMVGRQEHGYILLTLVSNLEKTFTISPASEARDGKMRVVHFGPESGEEVGRLMGLAYQGGKHVEEGNVTYDVVKGMRIEFLEENVQDDDMEGRWRRVCIDGLIVRVEEGGWMDVFEVSEAERPVDVVVAERND